MVLQRLQEIKASAESLPPLRRNQASRKFCG
ncbi:hypothetical protein SM11_chr2152 [Sinorhizobium meliloti SM11]|uniref:Uncharacterized protein n=1 Tax=Sinorhizobium meliloti (strain SM11) TaxID=707241 RepID=F7X1N8_SINMM|nr:hypothetical protein SM11_chr2152 [Sinorhizobium meliloti SM11]